MRNYLFDNFIWFYFTAQFYRKQQVNNPFSATQLDLLTMQT